MATFTRKTIPMRVERVRQDGDVLTWKGVKPAKRGDWLIYADGEDGMAEPLLLSDVLFRALYEPVDEEAKELLMEEV